MCISLRTWVVERDSVRTHADKVVEAEKREYERERRREILKWGQGEETEVAMDEHIWAGD